jgi:acetyltransferase
VDCEFAVAVLDEWQCRGIGTTLTQALFEYARQRGLRTVYGHVLADNERMIELARWLGLTVARQVRGEPTVRVFRRLD